MTTASNRPPASSPPNRSGATDRAVSKNVQRLGYRRIVQLLVYLIIIPTVLLLSVGILMMTVGNRDVNLILGILTVSFVGVVVVGVILVLVFVRREANLSRLQADFVSKVSHELKTPLTAIRLFSETLRERRNDEATFEQCIKHILEETDRLNAKLDRLLDWGRMESGKKVFELRAESLKNVAEEAVSSLKTQLATARAELESHFEEDLPSVLVDRLAVAEAIGNLLSNAMKYGGTPPKLVLRVFRDHGFACVSVTDDGSGIAHHEQDRIFEKFYRIDDRLSRAREGSGLGLAIVKHVVRAHNGRIDLDSDVGKGSTFTLRFPVRPSIEPPARAKSTSGSPDVPMDNK